MDIKSQVQEVLEEYSGLTYNEINNSLQGELFISKDDSYDIKILLDPYPENFPQVYEMGERIPQKVSRHIYSDTKSCCLSTQAKAQILLKTKVISLHMFVKEIVIPYLQNNSYFEINRKYKTDEYSHDKRGIIEGYWDVLQTKNNYQIARLIAGRIKGIKLRMHDICYCGSGLTLKKCTSSLHYRCYKDFRKIDVEILRYDINMFIN